MDINNNISKTPKDLISNFDSLKSSSSYCYHDFDPNFGYKTWFNAITNSTSACKVSPTEPHMGDGSPFTVFQEEHEGTLKFALPEGKNWYADSYFDQYNEQSYINTANWYFHITEDNLPVKNELWD